MAHLSEDQGLISAFNNGEDIHTRTACEVFNISIDKLTNEQRRNAKAINFGLIYGISAFGLSRQLRISRNLAAEYIDNYFARYPAVRKYMDSTREAAKSKGYVETLYGRRLYLPEINTGNAMRRQAAERAAINAPVQGTAADIMKKAMLTVHLELKKSKSDAKMVLQVHDELVIESPQEESKEISNLLLTSMSKAANLIVPLEVDIGIGSNWDQAH